MEVLEPLFLTATTVHDMLKASKEVSGELKELWDQINLIKRAIIPLVNQLQQHISSQTTHRLTKDNAINPSSNVVDQPNQTNDTPSSNSTQASEGTVTNSTSNEQTDANNNNNQDQVIETFDSSTLDILKALQELLDKAEKTMSEMKEERASYNNNNKGFFSFIEKGLKNIFRSKPHLEELRSIQEKLRNLIPIVTLSLNSYQHSNDAKNPLEMKTVSGSLASKNVSHLISNEQARNFWDQHFHQEYKVEWRRFLLAFEHEYTKKLEQDGITLKNHLKLFKTTVDKNGDDDVDIYEYEEFTKDLGVYEAFLKLINQTWQTKKPMKRKREDEEDVQGSNKIPKLEITQCEQSQDSNEANNTFNFSLEMFGKPSILNHPGCKHLLKMTYTLVDGKAFQLGREMFVKLPEDLLVRISRLHFEILGETKGTETQFYLYDRSGNGTYVNGKLVGRNNKVPLFHNDRIGILMKKPELIEVELGFYFNEI